MSKNKPTTNTDTAAESGRSWRLTVCQSVDEVLSQTLADLYLAEQVAVNKPDDPEEALEAMAWMLMRVRAQLRRVQVILPASAGNLHVHGVPRNIVLDEIDIAELKAMQDQPQPAEVQ